MATPREILAPFGLLPGSGAQIIGLRINEVARQIRERHESSYFDHRPFLPARDTAPYLRCYEFIKGYATFKYAVAAVLQPELIVEIGTGAGTAAVAFRKACKPSMIYQGIDDGSKDKIDEWDYMGYTKGVLKELGGRFEIFKFDSQQLNGLPACDFVHVDGDHTRKGANHDMRLALASGAEWILVDDSRDKEVVAGVFDAISAVRTKRLDWVYFEDTWTGNFLFHHREEL